MYQYFLSTGTSGYASSPSPPKAEVVRSNRIGFTKDFKGLASRLAPFSVDSQLSNGGDVNQGSYAALERATLRGPMPPS